MPGHQPCKIKIGKMTVHDRQIVYVVMVNDFIGPDKVEFISVIISVLEHRIIINYNIGLNQAVDLLRAAKTRPATGSTSGFVQKK